MSQTLAHRLADWARAIRFESLGQATVHEAKRRVLDSIGTATGPLIASDIFDRTKSYDAFFWIAIGMALIASMALFSLPKPQVLESAQGA